MPGLIGGRDFYAGREEATEDKPSHLYLTNLPNRAMPSGVPLQPAQPRGLVSMEQPAMDTGSFEGKQARRSELISKFDERNSTLKLYGQPPMPITELQNRMKLEGVDVIKDPVAAKAATTITKADGSIMQWNPESNRYDIEVSPAKVEGGEAGIESEIELARRKKEAEATGAGIGTRRQGTIDKGITAADGYANLVRAKELLDELDTGGVNAVSLRAKQIFGVEAPNEAELSNRLSKAVLSQLRATFGAAFTAQEGAKLERIEAGFGKSTAGNKRIIQQSMKIVEAAAQRGIRAAEKAGDKESAFNIREALAFTLAVDAETPPAAAQVATNTIEVLNPTTGETETWDTVKQVRIK